MPAMRSAIKVAKKKLERKKERKKEEGRLTTFGFVGFNVVDNAWCVGVT
jgi:hypothetical protein